jgi:uncharacterized protein
MEPKVIKPFHLFHYQGSWYVINIEEMSSIAIDKTTAIAMGKVIAEPTAPLESHSEEQLKTMGLLAKGQGQTPKTKKSKNEEIFPVVNLNLFLTQSCNLKCVYCYGDGGGYGTGGNMEEKTAFQAVDWLLEQSGKIKKLHIGFFGGEPFLNFTLMKAVVAYAETRVQEMGKQAEFHTTTNATMLDDEQIAFIKEHRLQVLVSLDGPKEVHDAQRPYANGQGSYDSIVPKIKKLLTAAPQTAGHAVLVSNTDSELVKNALIEIGFAEVSIKPAAKSLFAESDPDKAVRENECLIQALQQEAETWIRLVKSRDSVALKRLKGKSGLYHGMMVLLHNSKQRYACGAGLGLSAVSAVGDIYLCHRFVGMDEYKLGNVFEKDLQREKYQKSPIMGDGKCTVCFAKYYCAGGCKHENVGSGGGVATPSEKMCRLRCRELELAAVITGQLDPADKAFLIEQEIFSPKPCPFDF